MAESWRRSERAKKVENASSTQRLTRLLMRPLRKA